jgi:hypothetical protein
MSASSQPEQRPEPRRPAEDYHYVEFQVKRPGPIYQFKIWNISDHGLCILIKDTSDILNKINIDDVLTMNFHENNPKGLARSLNTKIVHITKKETGKFKGHFLAGLSVIV